MMKQFILIICVFCFGVLSSCTPKLTTQPTYTAQVNLVSESGNIIKLKSKVSGKEKKTLEKQAINNILNTLIFQGFANAESYYLRNPLIHNEQLSREKNHSYWKIFFDQNRYKQHVTSQTYTYLGKIKGIHSGEVFMTINLKSLKKNLRQNGIIKSLGYR
ncbi:MAG: hypothetical protein N4A45_09550 [Flavobacteriales bacterium]|jgi:hypothetical protein|nr:hypothetical protein [Flavobacteriales bacterium]